MSTFVLIWLAVLSFVLVWLFIWNKTTRVKREEYIELKDKFTLITV